MRAYISLVHHFLGAHLTSVSSSLQRQGNDINVQGPRSTWSYIHGVGPMVIRSSCLIEDTGPVTPVISRGIRADVRNQTIRTFTSGSLSLLFSVMCHDMDSHSGLYSTVSCTISAENLDMSYLYLKDKSASTNSACSAASERVPQLLHRPVWVLTWSGSRGLSLPQLQHL